VVFVSFLLPWGVGLWTRALCLFWWDVSAWRLVLNGASSELEGGLFCECGNVGGLVLLIEAEAGGSFVCYVHLQGQVQWQGVYGIMLPLWP
jgi:hypothetical protein